MRLSRHRALSAMLVSAMIAALAVALAPAAGAAGTTLYVNAATGSDTNACTQAAPCATIGQAVSVASAGDTIMVAGGTYAEDVTITTQLTLQAMGPAPAIVNASGLDNGIVVQGAGAAGTVISGFVVEHANFEGILVQQTSNVTVAGNNVVDNDLGMFAATPTGECAAQGQIPGDCGEGLHLMSVSGSRVLDNVVEYNAGGILLTDEMGPTNGNLIQGNVSSNNYYDCGITLAGHNTSAVASDGTPQPTQGGIYDNVVRGNVADFNGTVGEGAGVLIAGGAPGTAGYDNRIVGNRAIGNGLAGVTIHSHAPGQDLNGNVIRNNVVAIDGLTGNSGGPGDVDAGVTHRVGILVFSAVTPLTGTVISGNVIRRVYYGIWTMNAPAGHLGSGNTFRHVKDHVSRN